MGSKTSQKIDSVGCEKKGSTIDLEQSGISFMSDSLMAFQPAIVEPSNINPSARDFSSIVLIDLIFSKLTTFLGCGKKVIIIDLRLFFFDSLVNFEIIVLCPYLNYLGRKLL